MAAQDGKLRGVGAAEEGNLTPKIETETTAERVIELINKAQLAQSENKLSYLRQVQELILNKDPTLLDNFLDEIIVFQQDRSSDVRRFVISFVEEAGKKDPYLLTKTISTLAFMLGDDNVNVMKRVMIACATLYKVALQLVCKQRVIKEDMRDMWEAINELKKHICSLIDAENDGVRTHAIKFMEMLVLVHSKKGQDPDNSKEGDISLDIVPKNHPLVKLVELREHGGMTLEGLLTLCGSSSISSVNLMAVIGSLTTIAKLRPQFMSTTVQAFESLHANLPPTLAKSQVSSVRKNLKMQLFALLKHPSSVEFVAQIGTLLTDLGATQAELQRNLPRINPDSLKRAKQVEVINTEANKEIKNEQSATTKTKQAIDLTTSDLVPLLVKETVTELVLVSMLFLPKTMPTHFQQTFTPIAAAGGQAQVAHLARLMATQMTNRGIGIGVEKMQEVTAQEEKALKVAQDNTTRSIPVIGGDASDANTEGTSSPSASKPLSDVVADLTRGSRQLNALQPEAPQLRMRKIKLFKLSDSLKQFSQDDRRRYIVLAFQRILDAEQSAIQGGVTAERNKLLVGLAMECGDIFGDLLRTYILENFHARYKLALAWLYQEFLAEEAVGPGRAQFAHSGYSRLALSILKELPNVLESRDKLVTRFLLELPVFPEGMVTFVQEYCDSQDRFLVGFATLRELISKSSPKDHTWLQLLLQLTTSEKEQVRVQAIHSAKKLHTKAELVETIETFAHHSLQTLLHEYPPHHEETTARIEVAPTEWTDDSIKAHLYLYLALLPSNHTLFHELAEIYTEASPLIKRTILRHLEHPVRAVGMQSPELLKLVENCPTGAETLVTRILHIVTDKAAPTQELVNRVKDLYHKRVADVRFLIPVLNGLSKQEVIENLPKLVTQSANVVKEVFNRLLGCFQGGATTTLSSSLTPSELLVALHTIEAKSGDVKSIMKAINLCFAEKAIYTQEVLAVVLQQLLDINPLPTLFMRTVMQSLGACPRLINFVMNILVKLINKQVWKQPKAWQGFVKCCLMTKPQSFPVLLQLPPRQLESVFELSAELRGLLVLHVKNFTPHQRAHIPRSVLQVLEQEVKKDQPDEAESAGKDAESIDEKPAKRKIADAVEGIKDVKKPRVEGSVDAASSVDVKGSEES